MTNKDALFLHGVEETMLLPLWGRYLESTDQQSINTIAIIEVKDVDSRNV